MGQGGREGKGRRDELNCGGGKWMHRCELTGGDFPFKGGVEAKEK